MKKYFISGIGTDIGKTYVTAQLLRRLCAQGIRAASFKLVQTGMDSGIAADIMAHREGSGQALTALDEDGLSCGAAFPYPASPHLAAALVGQTIDGEVLRRRFDDFCQRSGADVVLCEGAGGIFVPLTDSMLTADWVAAQGLPLVLVCNAMLGSIHHTIATLEALAARSLLPELLIYNPYPQGEPLIMRDSERFLRDYVARVHPQVAFWTLDDSAALPPAFCYNSSFL